MPPCDWEVIGCEECDALVDLSEEIREAIEQRAINRLWEWTNHRFGLCEVTYVAESDECCLLAMRNPRCKNNEILLPGPIAEPIEILVDGAEVPIEDVRVEDYAYLVRLDGERFGRNWQVTYLQGSPVPPGGALVAGELACEYAKAACGDDTCRLPNRTSSITREGITIGMLDNFDNLKAGGTGIWSIDDWVMTYQTGYQIGPWQASVVSSPDLVKRRQITWTYAAS